MPSSKAADSEVTWLGFIFRGFVLTSSPARFGCQMQSPRSDSAGGAGKGREPRTVATNVTQHVMALGNSGGWERHQSTTRIGRERAGSSPPTEFSFLLRTAYKHNNIITFCSMWFPWPIVTCSCYDSTTINIGKIKHFYGKKAPFSSSFFRRHAKG